VAVPDAEHRVCRAPGTGHVRKPFGGPQVSGALPSRCACW
jgi:hypothetical protein